MLYLAHYWTLWAAGHTHLIVALSHHHPRHHRWHLGNWPHIKVALDQNGQSLTTKCFEVYTGCWSSTLLKVGPSPPMYSIGRRISISLLKCYPDLKGSIIPAYMEGLVMNGILHQSLGGVGRSTFWEISWASGRDFSMPSSFWWNTETMCLWYKQTSQCGHIVHIYSLGLCCK